MKQPNLNVEYKLLLDKVQEIIQPLIPTIYTHNNNIELSGNEKDYIFALFGYTTPETNVLIVLKNLTKNELIYKQIKNPKDINLLHTTIINMVLELFSYKSETELISITKHICSTLKDTLNELIPKSETETTIQLTNDTQAQLNIVFDNFLRLDSTNEIKNNLHNLLDDLK